MFGHTYCLLVGVLIHLTENEASAKPFTPTANTSCADMSYYLDAGQNLCCPMCEPGMRLLTRCTPESDTVCQPCPKGYYSQNRNYYPNCFKCMMCREDRGLQYVQPCSSSSPSACACREGMFCTLRDHNRHCRECRRYTVCGPGYGISHPGTTDWDVRCSPCPEGTYSDKSSYNEMCQQHTDCISQGRALLQPGNTVSDAVCGPVVRPITTRKPSTPSVTTLHPSTPSVTLSTTVPSVTYTASATLTTTHVQLPPPSSSEPQNNTWIVVLVPVVGAVVLVLVIWVTWFLNSKRAAKRENHTELGQQKDGPTSALKHHLLGPCGLSSGLLKVHGASGQALLGPQVEALKERHATSQATVKAEC